MTDKLINVMVFDDWREFKPTSPHIKHSNIRYCKSSVEFNVFLQEEATLPVDQTWCDVLVLDHDLGGIDTSRACAQMYANRLEYVPLENRPTVVIVTANPVGGDFLYRMFNDICIDVWRDPFGFKIGLTGG